MKLLYFRGFVETGLGLCQSGPISLNSITSTTKTNRNIFKVFLQPDFGINLSRSNKYPIQFVGNSYTRSIML